MRFRTCQYEEEVARELKIGHWPEGCDRELRNHVDACPNCSDLVLVTQTFRRARRESEFEVPRGSANLLWWRSQLRRRYAASQNASRPITIAQTFALVVYVVVGIVFVASQYNHGLHWALWRSEFAGRLAHLLPFGSTMLDQNLFLLIPCLGALALMTGLVLYLASEKS